MNINNAYQFPVVTPASNLLTLRFEKQLSNTLWITMNHMSGAGCQNFSLPLINELQDLLHAIRKNGNHWSDDGQRMPVRYMVLGSKHPEYFSLGGDLGYFYDCIQRRDRKALYQYSRTAMETTYEWATSSNLGITTIALVQGRALGGGFETALSADFLIAEEHSEFAFPEIMFGLFPCTGGMSLLSRRVGAYQAERMLSDPRLYRADELKKMGLIDEVCPRGEGDRAVAKFIAAHAEHRTARLLLRRARNRHAPLDRDEMRTVVEEWVAAAIDLDESHLRVMEMLSKIQRGKSSTVG